MKILTMVIHANMQHDLADILRSMDCIKEFTFSQVQGHGAQDTKDAFLSMRDRVVGYSPHIRVEIMLEDTHVSTVLKKLRGVVKHSRDQGVYWVTSVDESGLL
ncbi:MAG: hypothetical protein COB41_03895 [Proteobacteria bacterium]|nr:MAG: hypothetical protein COB41_03895 [Pseudomonadota bacterium]